MTDRARLPNRRAREGFELEHRGTRFTVCIGRDVDAKGNGSGRIKELFFSSTKAGTDIDGDARDLGLLFSLLIQHGATIGAVRAALTRKQDGKPAGLLGHALDRLEQIYADDLATLEGLRDALDAGAAP
jgi:ribonucleoside-diphosphate reductase alpha chain